jgi:hypothetical protein
MYHILPILLTNVHSTAQEARTDTIDRLVKESGNSSCGLYFVGITETVFALADDTKCYLLPIFNAKKYNGILTSLDIAIEVLHCVITSGRRQVNGAILAVTNTNAK